MLLDDLGDVLSSASIGVLGTTLFKGMLPSTPDACVAILGPYGGLPPVWAMSPGAASGGRPQVERPRVQVLCRDTRYDSAEQKAVAVRFVLDGLGGVTKNGIAYKAIFAVQEPFYLERDANNREIFAANYEVVRNAATSS